MARARCSGRPRGAGQPAGAGDDRADAGVAGPPRAGRPRPRGGVLLPKDALRAALVPDAPPGVTDRSDASATLLWDVPGDRWSRAAGRRGGDPAELLPEVRPGAEVVGTTPDDVPVVVGGADTPLALLAAGSEAEPARQRRHRRAGPAPRRHPRPVDAPVVHCYADVEDGWYAMAALQNGGSAWAWVCGVLGLSWGELFDAAATVAAGAGRCASGPS